MKAPEPPGKRQSKQKDPIGVAPAIRQQAVGELDYIPSAWFEEILAQVVRELRLEPREAALPVLQQAVAELGGRVSVLSGLGGGSLIAPRTPTSIAEREPYSDPRECNTCGEGAEVAPVARQLSWTHTLKRYTRVEARELPRLHQFYVLTDRTAFETSREESDAP